MKKQILLAIVFLFSSFYILSCSKDDDKQNDNDNYTEVAVTGSVAKIGISYAIIDGYVNLNLVTESYTNPQIGVELSEDKDFKSSKTILANELEGNKLLINARNLNAKSNYYYRTFVRINKLAYYGQKRYFMTKDFTNIITTGQAYDINRNSAKIKCMPNSIEVDTEEDYNIGIAYSTSKSRLDPDSIAFLNISEITTMFDDSISITLSKLKENTTYYYCPFTSVGNRCLFGDIKSFTTNYEYTPARRTVIVFMSADNTLSSFTSGDFQELVNGAYNSLSSSDRLVVFVDRISTKEKPFIACITGNKKQPVDTLYKYSEDPYVTDPSVFKESISRIMTLCPAKEYGLVLWGYGSGWCIEKDTRSSAAPHRSFGVDNGNNASKGNKGLWLSIPDMRTCFEQLGIKWKYIFADCCNMMCAEVAYELRNWAGYLIGSPAEIPSYGAPYNKIVRHLFSQSDTFYEDIVDTYAADYSEYLPLSAIRLSEMEQLAVTTKAVLPAIAEHLHQGDTQATKNIIYYYSPGGRNDNINKSMYDMNDMIRTALIDQPEVYETWHQAFMKAVPKRVIASMWETMNAVNFSDFTVTDAKMGCVSMFFPLDKYNSSSCLYTYNTDIQKMQWYQAVGWSAVGN